MKHRAFNSLMHFANENWAAQILGMKVHEPPSPDLIDDKKLMEVKFSLVNVKRRYPLSWTVLEYQMGYPQEYQREGFWGLGKYWMNQSISDVTREKAQDRENLEKMVTRREIYIVLWDWMQQFPSSNVSGKTNVSEWNNTVRYPKFYLIPPVTKKYKVKKGLVFLTEGVNPDDFPSLKL